MLRVVGLILLLSVGAIFLRTHLAADTKAKQLKAINSADILSIKLSQYRRGAYDPSANPIGKVQIAIVTNSQDILFFKDLLNTNMSKWWNHFGVVDTYSFVIVTRSSQFEFEGVRIGTREALNNNDIWVRLAGNEGLLVPHLYDWIQLITQREAHGAQPKSNERTQ